MKHSFRKLCAYVCAVAFMGMLVVSCGGTSTTNGGGGGGTGDSATLTSNDFPSFGICASGSTDVANTTFVAALTAMANFTLLHLPYSSDGDIPFICGKQGTWDPSTTNALTPSGFGAIDVNTTIATIFGGGAGQVFICNDGFGFTSGATAGLHSATTWRGEITFSDGANTYQVRLRFTVSGDDVNKTLAELGITAGDLSLEDSDGNTLTTVADVLALFAADAGSVTVNLVSNGTTHLTALGRIICWEQI